VDEENAGGEGMTPKQPKVKLIRGILQLAEWRDTVTTKKKARAIQRVIDKKLKQCDRFDMIYLEITEKTHNIKVSAW
jgi:hypothetical protein